MSPNAEIFVLRRVFQWFLSYLMTALKAVELQDQDDTGCENKDFFGRAKSSPYLAARTGRKFKDPPPLEKLDKKDTLEVQSTKQRMVFRMIHGKDSRSYQWAKFGRLGLPGGMYRLSFSKSHHFSRASSPGMICPSPKCWRHLVGVFATSPTQFLRARA